MAPSMDVVKEGDLLLDMFQKEFKKMHSELVDKEVRLFHHIFHHLFSSRLAKLEQFLQLHYDEFEDFEPEYAPINPLTTSNTSNTTQQQKQHNTRAQKSKPKKTNPVKDEQGDYEDDLLEEDAEPFFPENYENDGSAFDTDNFILVNDSDEDSSFSDESNPVTKKKRKLSKNSSSSHPKHSSSSVVSTTNPSSGKGRKRHPIWECYTTSFAQNGKILSNDCKLCNLPVSAKAWRMQMHLLKCTEIHRGGELQLSKEMQINLKQFKAKLKIEQQQNLSKEKKGSVSSSNIPTASLTNTEEQRSSHQSQHHSHVPSEMQEGCRTQQGIGEGGQGSNFIYQGASSPTPINVPPNSQNFPNLSN